MGRGERSWKGWHLGSMLSEFCFPGGTNGGREGGLISSSPEESVKEDVEILRKSAFFRGMQIWGSVLDTHTGVVREVVGV